MSSGISNRQQKNLLHEHADCLGTTMAASKAKLSDTSARFLGLAKA
ncbi:hypothetical protein [Salinibacterium sp. NK8237]|nr:hypothetical protein [Salinibacterium sp. NK8237]MBH0131446.1 hypothetical protein [Salinibacterium sp. NK8237]